MWYVDRDGEEVPVSARPEGEGLVVKVGAWEAPVRAQPLGRNLFEVEIRGRRMVVYRAGDRLEILAPFRAWLRPVPLSSVPRAFRNQRKGPARQRLVAPMTGRVVEVHVAAGQTVEEGTLLLVMEAMKMRNELRAPFSGKVLRVEVEEGSVVNRGDLLVEMESAA